MLIGFTIEGKEGEEEAFRFAAQYASKFPAVFLDIGLVNTEVELKKLCNQFTQNTDWKHSYIVKPDVEFVNETVKFIAEDRTVNGSASFARALKYFDNGSASFARALKYFETKETTPIFPISYSINSDITNYDCALESFNHAETLQRFLVTLNVFLDLNNVVQWWMEIGNEGKDVDVLLLGLENLDLVGADEILFRITRNGVTENPLDTPNIKTWKTWATDICWSPLAPLNEKTENKQGDNE